MPRLHSICVAVLIGAGIVSAGNDDGQNTGNFTIINGQVFTPGLAVLDSPQPFTPEGGDFLQVALDITGSGRLPWPNNPSNSPTVIHNITLFLSSYITGFNFTISNSTTNSSSDSNALDSSSTTNSTAPPLGNILLQEPSSTVKHVNWLWPSCLVGNGAPSTTSSARGSYNISIHQSYRLNSTEYYTIFDLPISVTNSIPDQPSTSAFSNDPAPGPQAPNQTRIACDLLQNPLLNWTVVNQSVHAPASQPYLGGSVVVSGSGSSGSDTGSGSGSGSSGNGASGINSSSGASSNVERWSKEATTAVALAVVGLVSVGSGFMFLG